MPMIVDLDKCVLTATAATILGVHRRVLRELIRERPDLRPPLLDHSWYVWTPEHIDAVRAALREGGA